MIKRKKRIKKENNVVIIKFFSITTDMPEKFVDDLDDLCKRFSKEGNYFFNFSVEDSPQGPRL